MERFGPRTLERITQDNDVICTTEYSRIVPLENGEVGCTALLVLGLVGPCCFQTQSDGPCPLQIVVSLVNGRPGARNFSYSPVLRDFTKATNIRLRFLRTNTLLGHLMGKALRDPTVTRRVSAWVWLETCSGEWAGAGGMVRRHLMLSCLHCSIITASKTSASAAAASVMATQMSVTLRTPRILSGETCGSLSVCLSVLIYLLTRHSSGFPTGPALAATLSLCFPYLKG